jgi:hypothetical protein
MKRVGNNRNAYKLKIDVSEGSQAPIATVTSNNLEKIQCCINCLMHYHPILKEYVILNNKNDEITIDH